MRTSAITCALLLPDSVDSPGNGAIISRGRGAVNSMLGGVACRQQEGIVMPQYVAIGTHDPGECPGASGKMREVWKKVLAGAPAMRDKHGIKLIAGPMHLDPSHKVLALVEAPHQDALHDYLMESYLGAIQA